nr:translocation/assembly module TamB domain-containing protein [Chromobacterium sp. ASV5]
MTDPDLSNPPDAAPAPPPAPPKKRSAWRWLAYGALALLLALLLAAGWATSTRSGFAWLMQSLGGFSQQTLSVGRADGALWQGFTLEDVRLRSAGSDVDIESLRLEWQPSALWRRELHVTRLAIGHVRVASKPEAGKPSQPLTLPRSLKLPLTVRLERLSVASVSLKPAELAFYDLAGGYRYDGVVHRLKLARLTTPWGKAAAGLNVTALAPFALSGKLQAKGRLDDIPVAAQLALSGSLTRLSFAGKLSGKMLGADLNGTLLPFDANPFNKLERLDVRVGGINPQAILPSWPRGDLSFAVFAEPDAGQRIKGGLTLLNGLPGPLSDHKLPLALLSGEFRVDDHALEWFNSQARLAGGQMGIAGEVRSDRIKLALDLSGVALRQLHAAAPDDALSGRVTVEGSAKQPRIEANLKGRTLQASSLLELTPAPQQTVLLRKLDLGVNGGAVHLDGKLGLAGKQLFELNGRLSRADPSKLRADLPRGDLNATLKAAGQLAAPLDAGLKLQFAPSTLSGAPLSGMVNLQWAGERLKQLLMDVRLASNRLQASGSYGAAGDRLKLAVNAPNLGLIGPGFAGAIVGQGELAGTPKIPVLNAKLQADRLRLPGGVSLQSLQFAGNVKADQASPFQLSLDVAALQAGGLRAEAVRARAGGTRARHSLQLDGRFRLAEQNYGLQFEAAGGLGGKDGKRWQGSIQKLLLSGQPDLSLQAPASLELDGGNVKLGAARLALLGGSLNLASFSRQASGALETRGSARGLRLAELGSWLKLPFSQNLAFDSDWDLHLGNRASGQLQLWRSAGDIAFPAGKGQTASLGLKTAAARVRLDGNHAAFDLNLDSRLAQLQGKGSLPWNGGDINGKTPLAATVSASAPSLALLAELAGPGLELQGQLAANLDLAGPLAMPQAQGTIRGAKLELADHRTGVKLGGGELAARLDGRRLLLDKLRFVGGGGAGDLVASGMLDLSDEQPDARVRVQLQKFSVFDRADRRLVVSGDTELSMIAGKLALKGRIRADQGRVALPKQGAPTLGGDVVVVGRAPPEPSAFASMPLTVALDLDLGERFRFTGQGLDVTLTGAVHVSANPGEAPAAKGQVRVVRGRYKAYGQDLDISFGAITFNGPLDNPLLNVQAKRRLSPVGAGVEVSGSVSAPKVRLIADEPMTDKDKLAWLVLGRAASGDRDDNDLAASAGMMLAGSVNDHIGLFDDLGVTSRKEKTLANGTVSPAEQVVTVGRQLTRELYLGYEYGITSADQAVKLAYQLTKSWSVVLRAGTAMSAESRYTLRFD